MKVLFGMTKPVIAQLGRLGRSWPSSQAGHSRRVVSVRQFCSPGNGYRSGISVPEFRKDR